MASKSAGTTIALKIFRDGKEIDRKITLKARDEDSKTKPVTMKDEGGSKSESKSNYN